MQPIIANNNIIEVIISQIEKFPYKILPILVICVFSAKYPSHETEVTLVNFFFILKL